MNARAQPVARWPMPYAWVALGYFALAVLSIHLSHQGAGLAGLWYANGFGVAALLSRPVADSPRVLATLIAACSAANGVMVGLGWALPVFVAANAGEMALAAALFRWRSWGNGLFTQPLELLKALAFSAAVPAIFVGALTSAALHGLQGSPFARVWYHWVEGSVIGSVSIWPLALFCVLRGPAAMRACLAPPPVLPLMAASIGATLLIASSLPFPFVFVVLIPMWMALRHGFGATALLVFATSITLASLIALGVIVPPPSTWSWGEWLLFLPILATLLPPLVMAAAVQSNHAYAQRLERLYEKSPVMMHSIGPDGRLLSVSDLWLNRLGYRREQVIGRPSTDFLSAESAQRARDEVLPQFMRTGHVENVSYQMLESGGGLCDVLLSARAEYDDDGEVLRTMAVIEDVTDKKRLQHDLTVQQNLAEQDPLTGLLNRHGLEMRLSQACQSQRGTEQAFCVAFMDLDRFKPVNDTLGHAAGDQLLREVARRLQSSLRTDDSIARIGGDEFVMLMPHLKTRQQASVVAEKLLQALAQPVELGGQTVQVSASVGLALFPSDGHTPADLLSRADAAMYQAKQRGRNRSAFAG